MLFLIPSLSAALGLSGNILPSVFCCTENSVSVKLAGALPIFLVAVGSALTFCHLLIDVYRNFFDNCDLPVSSSRSVCFWPTG